MKSLFLPDADATHALGVRLGRAAFPGAVVALVGDLGAGKTSLAKGVGAGLGVKTRIQSPTFVIVQAHLGGRLPLWHADLYRVGDASELDEIGLEEHMEGDGLVLIEWASRFPEILPDDHLVIHLTDASTGRRAALRATGPRHAALLDALGG